MAFLQKASYLSAEVVKNFKGRGGFVELRKFDKRFVKNTRKKVLQQNILHFFSPRYSQNRKCNLEMEKIRVFFSAFDHFVGLALKGFNF